MITVTLQWKRDGRVYYEETNRVGNLIGFLIRISDLRKEAEKEGEEVEVFYHL